MAARGVHAINRVMSCRPGAGSETRGGRVRGWRGARRRAGAGFALAVALGGGGSVGAEVPAADAAVAARLRVDVTELAEGIGARTVFQGDSLARAERYVADGLATAGWAVARQTYRVGNFECANLVAERKGTDRPGEIVVIGAHYDTVPQTPGADDNASGVAVMLALARELAAVKPSRTLRLVAFANEEPVYFQTSLMGSLVYARACRARGDRITAMLSLETMGYFRDEKDTQKYPFPLSLFYPSRGDFIAVVGNRDSKRLVQRVTKVFRSTRALPCESAALPGGLQGVGWSDHWSFWQAGYPAVMITDTAPFRNPHYHRPSDRPDTLDYPRLAAAVRALRAVVLDLVDGS